MWTMVADFKSEVKVGDKVKKIDKYTDWCPEIVTALGRDGFLSSDGQEEFYHTYLDQWQVLRESKRWRAPAHDLYYIVATEGVTPYIEMGTPINDMYFNLGNYWRQLGQAKVFRNEIKKLAMKLHNEFGE